MPVGSWGIGKDDSDGEFIQFPTRSLAGFCESEFSKRFFELLPNSVADAFAVFSKGGGRTPSGLPLPGVPPLGSPIATRGAVVGHSA